MLPSSSPLSTINSMHLPQTRAEPLPITPTKTKTVTNQDISPQSNGTTPISSLRERRGRKCDLYSGSFRPLSVFTKSLLLPFNLDTDKAFDILQKNSLDRPEDASNALQSETQEAMDASDGFVHRQPFALDHSQISVGTRHTVETIPSSRDSDMDLITALQLTSPDKDSTSKVTADFATLCELPIPEPSQHPAWHHNPFEIRTEAPLLFTSTTIDEVRSLNSKNSHLYNQPSQIARDSVERRKGFFGLDFRTPASARSRNAFSSEDSPLNMVVSRPSNDGSHASMRGSSPFITEFTIPKESASSSSANGSVRKFSDLFRRKDSIERNSDSPTLSPRNSQDSPNLDRQDLEKYVRRTTNTPTYDFDPYSHYPRHPNTGRGWKSRNLKCTTCTAESCAVCHRVCCAYRAAVLASSAHGEGSEARTTADQRIQEITKLFPYGREVPTFLQCTAGIKGDKVGCGKIVCPDCCSICIDNVCGDTLCRKCKPAMWEECEWHKGDVLGLEPKSKVSEFLGD